MPMGALLFRVTGAQTNRGYTILAGHPLTKARLAAIKKADQGNCGAELLSAAQWRALEDICGPSRHDLGPGQDGNGEDEAR